MAAMRQAITESVPASTRTIEYARRRTGRVLAAEHGEDVAEMPSRATFYRLFIKLSSGVPVTGSARTRQSLANQCRSTPPRWTFWCGSTRGCPAGSSSAAWSMSPPAPSPPRSCGRLPVCGRGKAFISENFRAACRTLEINFQPCHPRSPAEKPHIERTLESVATMFCQFLPGYVGPYGIKINHRITTARTWAPSDANWIWVRNHWEGGWIPVPDSCGKKRPRHPPNTIMTTPNDPHATTLTSYFKRAQLHRSSQPRSVTEST
ncbi:hypothetical protein AB0H77_41490 [Streptomyces sp. NPDC050844]|uniref:hypothetical protein n=1 Tax=Streptomyces sp. NPDC050844 TaxID=3155790 RepID=UPI003405A9C4